MEQEIEQIIVRNLSGEASSEDLIRLSEWLALKEENKTSFLRCSKYWRASVSGIRIQDKEDAYKQLVKRIGTSRRMFPRWFKYAGIAAAIALLIGVAAFWGVHKSTPEAIHHYSYVTGNSASTFNLPDGTEVSLNKHSTLTYSNQYGIEMREVALQGEAYFNVVKNKERKFIVDLNDSRITVLGTTFNVRQYPEENKLTATLIEGSIQFETPQQTVILKPNQQLAYSRLDDQLIIDMIDSEIVTAWKDNLLRYKSIPFADFLSQLGEQYGVEILLPDKELGVQIVSGSFDMHLSVEQILTIMKKSLSFNWNKKDNTFIITK